MSKVELYATIQMDRPADEEIHYITPGGYCFCFGGKSIEFDFSYSGWSVDENDPTIIHISCDTLDTDFSPESAVLEDEHLPFPIVTEIEEFFVYTGEHTDPEINAISLKEVYFAREGYTYHISQDIIDSYNQTLQTQQLRMNG